MSRLVWFACWALFCVNCVSADADEECGVNEEISDCIQVTCSDQACITKNYPQGCPAIIFGGSCKKGCCVKEAISKTSSAFVYLQIRLDNPCIGSEWKNCSHALCKVSNKQWQCVEGEDPQIGDWVFLKSWYLSNGAPSRVINLFSNDEVEVSNIYDLHLRVSKKDITILPPCKPLILGVEIRAC